MPGAYLESSRSCFLHELPSQKWLSFSKGDADDHFTCLPTSQAISMLWSITFFKCGPADPSQQCKRASNSIQDPPPHWNLTTFKLKFSGGNLFSPAMTSTKEGNNSMGSLLEPLLKKVIPVVGSRMLCSCKYFAWELCAQINFVREIWMSIKTLFMGQNTQD
jgi:hypothetical protein